VEIHLNLWVAFLVSGGQISYRNLLLGDSNAERPVSGDGILDCNFEGMHFSQMEW
jgi:hypothetical protein